ncbi:hypothetical protein DFH06DRAFT_1130417 [Mycena polygramma]|nr:hypothetical protein DFH06DRAFT_1130417 [Mycena polygramma]
MDSDHQHNLDGNSDSDSANDTSGTSSTPSDSDSTSSSESSGSDDISGENEYQWEGHYASAQSFESFPTPPRPHGVQDRRTQTVLRNLHVSPETFDELVFRIEDHPVFSNNSRNPQTPTFIQLAITVYCFGHDGNAASVDSIVQWAGLITLPNLRIIDYVIGHCGKSQLNVGRHCVRVNLRIIDYIIAYCGSVHVLTTRPSTTTLQNLRIIDYIIAYCGSVHVLTTRPSTTTGRG